MHMPGEWTEVNLVPPAKSDGLKVLSEIIDPLVHGELNERIDSWHYGVYEEPEPEPFHLRLRIKWKGDEQAASDKEAMFKYLDNKVHQGELTEQFEGCHGKRGKIYPGEQDTYKEMWDATYRFWEGQSEFALTLLKYKSAGLLSEDLTWHWESTAHLFSNRLLLNPVDEVYLGLQRARAYTVPESELGLRLAQMQVDTAMARQGTGAEARSLLSESIQKRFNKDFRGVGTTHEPND
jgi:hypothetical protein